MKTIYIVADSRGKRLEDFITPPQGYRIKVTHKGGATLQWVLGEAKRIINQWPCELVYIHAGICSITQKENGKIELPYDSADDIYKTTKELFKAVITDLDQYDDTPVIISQLVGVDLKAANQDPSSDASRKRKRGKKHPQQIHMDQAILRLNDYIKLLNTERGHETPELAGAVHKHHGTKGWSHAYNHLRDGVHPTDTTLKYWGKRYEENIGLFVKKR